MIHVKSMVRRLRLGINPIVVKELRSRMRGMRAFAILTGVLLLLAGVSYILYRVVLTATRYSSTPVSPQVGQTLFVGLALVELLMICFVTPAITAGAISGEQERLTYEILLATPLRPASILWGKLISALGYVFLLIFAAVPMASLVFIYGGVTPVDMLKTLAILAATAVTLGVIGVFVSTWLERTARATVISYLVALGLLIGPLLLYVMAGVLVQGQSPRWLLAPSPISALFSALAIASPYGKQISFLSELGYMLGGFLGIRPGGVPLPYIPRPLYHYTLVLYGGLSLVLYLLATRLVRPSRRWHIRWREALGALVLVAVLGGAAAVPFALTADRYERVRVEPTPMPPSLAPGGVETKVVRIEPTPTTSDARAFSEADQVAVYVATIRQLYAVDHIHPEPYSLEAISIERNTDDTVGDPEAPQSDSVPISEWVQTAVTTSLADLGPGIEWVDEDGMLTLGNVHVQADGSALVSARFHYSASDVSGKTYVMARIESIWQITGDTGIQ